MFSFLHKKIDNSPVVAFRIIFGLLLSWQCLKMIVDRTVYQYYILPKHTLTFIGFDWLQPLPGRWMFAFHIVMAIAASGIAVGYRYKASLGIFTLLWTAEYLMQKTWYNNHAYLVILLCLFMFVVPANSYASIDSRKNPALRKDTMPYWCLLIFILQIAIMYFFAAIAKLYPDWVDGTYIKVMLNNRGTQWMGSLRNNTTLHVVIAICGFLFDLLIVPMLFFKRTRPVATIAAVCFHLFNSVTLKIGIFPYLSLSFLLFFYPQETVRRLFFPKKPVSIDIGNIEPEKKDTGFIKYILIPYFVIQLFLPLRHYFIKGDVLWTEEGYRLSWMMMLKSKLGSIDFTIRDKQTGKKIDYNPEQLLTKNQIFSLKGRPDMIWQVAQLIKEDFAKKGKDVAVFVEAKVGLNGHTQRLIIDPRVDLAAAKFSYFGHDEWVLTYDRELLFK